MTSTIELLQKKFKATGYETVAAWMRANDVDLSLQSCTSVLHRSEDKGLVVMLTLASSLNCTADEMKEIAREKGDKTLWRLITKNALSKEDALILAKFKAVSPEQRKNVVSLLDSMAPKEVAP